MAGSTACRGSETLNQQERIACGCLARLSDCSRRGWRGDKFARAPRYGAVLYNRDRYRGNAMKCVLIRKAYL
jgi:hypothetical protein